MANLAANGTNWTAQQTIPQPNTVNPGTVAWAVTTAYVAGQIITNAGGDRFLVTVAGTSAGAPPTWPTTFGGTVVDSGVTWKLVGQSIFEAYKVKGADATAPTRNDFTLEVKPA